jgi:hypothetical protein
MLYEFTRLEEEDPSSSPLFLLSLLQICTRAWHLPLGAAVTRRGRRRELSFIFAWPRAEGPLQGAAQRKVSRICHSKAARGGRGGAEGRGEEEEEETEKEGCSRSETRVGHGGAGHKEQGSTQQQPTPHELSAHELSRAAQEALCRVYGDSNDVPGRQGVWCRV